MTAPAAAHAPLFALLRSGPRWRDVELDGLEILGDGTIELQRLPQVSPPSLSAPGPADVGGLAWDCDGTIVASAGEAIVRLDRGCADPVTTGLAFAPAGLALAGGRLYAADPVGGRIVVLDAATLTQLDEWTGLTRPTALAADGARVVAVDGGAVAVLDRAGRLRRRLVAANARTLALDADGTVCVGGAGASLRRFDRDGAPLAPLALGFRPAALAVEAGVLYAADRQGGAIALFGAATGRRLGDVVGFSGPVAALAACGRLLAVLTGDGSVLWAPAEARAQTGTLTTLAPLDAGEDATWLTAEITASAPAGTDVDGDVAAVAHAADAPAWRPLGAALGLVEPAARFAHVRIRLARRVDAAAGASPTLEQVELRTGADSLLDRLPAVYARLDSDAGDLLRRLLALGQAELDRLESRIADLARTATPATATAGELARTALWQALTLPPSSLEGDAAAARVLLAGLPALLDDRGTPAGVARYVEAMTGARPHLLEHFRSRSLWALGGGPGLGVGTRLAPAALDGMVVGASAVGESVPDDPRPPGAPLFEEAAHRFTAIVPAAAAPTEAARARVRRALEQERPAHTNHHLCFATAAARAGVQATVGVDAIVGGTARGAPLDGTRLGVDARLADTPGR